MECSHNQIFHKLFDYSVDGQLVCAHAPLSVSVNTTRIKQLFPLVISQAHTSMGILDLRIYWTHNFCKTLLSYFFMISDQFQDLKGDFCHIIYIIIICFQKYFHNFTLNASANVCRNQLPSDSRLSSRLAAIYHRKVANNRNGQSWNSTTNAFRILRTLIAWRIAAVSKHCCACNF